MKVFAITGALMFFAGFASAATVNGILMDKMCSAKAVSGGQSVATAHQTSCATMPACEQSGYGVFTADGKYVAFDAAGNDKAIAALKATKKTSDLKVRVTGDVNGDTMTVKTLRLL